MLVDRFSYPPVFVLASVMPLIGVLILFGTLGNYRRLPLASTATAHVTGE